MFCDAKRSRSLQQTDVCYDNTDSFTDHSNSMNVKSYSKCRKDEYRLYLPSTV